MGRQLAAQCLTLRARAGSNDVVSRSDWRTPVCAFTGLSLWGFVLVAGPAEGCEERAGTVNSKHARSD